MDHAAHGALQHNKLKFSGSSHNIGPKIYWQSGNETTKLENQQIQSIYIRMITHAHDLSEKLDDLS
jgi:hypothetical protein